MLLFVFWGFDGLTSMRPSFQTNIKIFDLAFIIFLFFHSCKLTKTVTRVPGKLIDLNFNLMNSYWKKSELSMFRLRADENKLRRPHTSCTKSCVDLHIAKDPFVRFSRRVSTVSFWYACLLWWYLRYPFWGVYYGCIGMHWFYSSHDTCPRWRPGNAAYISRRTVILSIAAWMCSVRGHRCGCLLLRVHPYICCTPVLVQHACVCICTCPSCCAAVQTNTTR